MAVEADLHESYVHCIRLGNAVTGPELKRRIQ